MDNQVRGLVLNWLGNTASSEDLDLVKQVIEKREKEEGYNNPPTTFYTSMNFMGLDLTPLMREQIHKGNTHLVLAYFTINKNMEKIKVIEILRRYIVRYVSIEEQHSTR